MSEGDGTHSVSELGCHKGVCDIQIFVAHPVFLRGGCPGKPGSIIFPSVFTTCNATNNHCCAFTCKVDHSPCSWERRLTLILPRSHTGTVWFYTSTSNKRAARPKLYTKSLTRDLKLTYSRFKLVRISINL